MDVERDAAPARLGLGAADRRAARAARARRAHAVLAAEAVGGSGRAAAAADGHRRSGRCAREARPADRPGRGARGPAGDGRGGDRRCSRPSRRRARPTCCSPKPEPASARRSPISRPPRCGRSRRAARCGSRPSPRRCSGSSTREGPKLFADAEERARRIVVRKGRENYLCLLNLEDALQGAFAGRAAILAQLVGRWAAYTKDGDMVGGDLPGWLPSLFRRAGATALTDRRGECVYAGCPHYRRCFIERAERASREADIVIANHALVMVNAARAREDAPGRILFDEGHHLFDAADSTFAVAFGGQEAIELRRWIVGPEGRSRGRRRGLAARLMDVASYDEEGARALEAAVEAAKALPSDGWLQRLVEGAPFGPVEALLAEVRGDGLRALEGAGGGLRARDRACRARRRAGLGGRRGGRGARSAAASRSRRSAGGSRRCSRTRPTGSTAQARARVEGAIRGLSWRRETLAAWIALARADRRRGRPRVRRLAGGRAGRRARISTSRSTAAGSIRPSRSPRRCSRPADGVLVTSATLRGGEDWAGRRGAHRRAAPAAPAAAFRGGEPVRLCRLLGSADRHRRQAGRHRRARRRLCAADRGGERRDARACSPRSSG